MNELLERAFLVSNAFAYEIVDSEEFGKRIIKVTDCEDERNIAIFFVKRNTLVEKVSNFYNEERYATLKDNISKNIEFILEGYHEN